MLKSIRTIISSTNYMKSQNLMLVNRFFTSDLSLEKLYPNSSLKITTPNPPPKGEKFNGYIPMNELEITYSRSSGPGGQNVNTINTKVDLRFKFDKISFISDETKKRMMEQYKHRITKEGYFVIKSELTRHQQLNLADALEKLRTVIRESEKPVTKEPNPDDVIIRLKR
uniref:Large ribosomal subunit protein mL62 n=1 Tax=Culicoides sonorensis TaxID=179676 RepID=A0A336MUC9_CULSO